MRSVRVLAIAASLLSAISIGVPQAKGQLVSLPDRAVEVYRNYQYATEERHFRENVQQNPSDVLAQFSLGQTLFKQKRFADAIAPFEKARELEAGGSKLKPGQHRILVDRLVIAYGASGDLRKTRELLADAIRQDPDYALNYYNLACAAAVAGEKAQVLTNLQLAYQHRDHFPEGERMPDPRRDDTFFNYVHDADFVALTQQMGYN